MPKWKRSAILFTTINILEIIGTIYDYYEFFIKECRDAFPFGYCPGGAESMGWAWRSRDAYLNSIIETCCVESVFLPLMFYAFYKKRYGLAFCFALGPCVIFWIRGLVEYLIYA